MKIIITGMLCILSMAAMADDFIEGKKTVNPGSIETYTVNWPSWSNTYEFYANVTWNVSSGTVLSSDKHSITIQWDDVPRWLNGEGIIEVYEDLGAQTGYASITIFNFSVGTIQTCSGILGSAGIFVDFGAGPNPGPPLPAGNTTYPYSASCSLQPGLYTRTNSTVGCNALWLGLPEDHTPGDVNGYMLLVDGDDAGQIVYRTTVNGLVQAFGYEFSVYVANLSNPSFNFQKPKLQFEVYDMSNNLLGQSGYIEVEYVPANPWQKMSFMFDLPTGTTSVQVVLRNDHNSPYGNDFVVDDLSFAPCFPPIVASFASNSIVQKSYACNNGSVNLYSWWPTQSMPFPNPAFKWQRSVNNGVSWADIPGANAMNAAYTENTAGIYQYRVYAYSSTNPSLYVISNVLTHFVQKMVVAAKTYNIFSCNSVSIELSPDYYLQYADPYGPALTYTYNWSPATYLNNPAVEKPKITLPYLNPPSINSPAPPPPAVYTYNLTIQNTNFTGCVGAGIQTVKHFNPRKVAVPTAFTPGAATNSLFRPINLQDYPGGEFWVWTRWGNLIFHSTGPTLLDYSWNGTYPNGQGADPDTYVWRVNIPGCPNNILNGAGNNNPYGYVLLIR